MNLDNLELSYYSNGKIKVCREIDSNGIPHGFYVDWHFNGNLWEISNNRNGRKHGKMIAYSEDGTHYRVSHWEDGEVHGVLYNWGTKNETLSCREFYYHGHDITYEIKALVDDINNISEQEKTLIAIKYNIEFD